MARHKYVKCDLEGTALRSAKKRERIRKLVDIVWAVLMIICILVCGLNQHNDLSVGWGLIIMGIITLPVAVFYLYIYVRGWKPLARYDYSENIRYISEKERQKDTEEYYVIFSFVRVCLFLLAIGLPVLGIFCLLDIL